MGSQARSCRGGLAHAASGTRQRARWPSGYPALSMPSHATNQPANGALRSTRSCGRFSARWIGPRRSSCSGSASPRWATEPATRHCAPRGCHRGSVPQMPDDQALRHGAHAGTVRCAPGPDPMGEGAGDEQGSTRGLESERTDPARLAGEWDACRTTCARTARTACIAVARMTCWSTSGPTSSSCGVGASSGTESGRGWGCEPLDRGA